jgi:predicted MPP superfamily phosphohydrolase
MAIFAAAGLPVLHNAARAVRHHGRAVWIAGLGSQWAYRGLVRRGIGADDLAATLRAVPDATAPVILLAHEPDIFPRVPARVALTLSGHTHGGQVRLAGWSPVVPSRFGNRYAWGHVEEEGRHLVVSGGIGHSILPVRFGMPSEVTLVTLGAATAAAA